MGSSSHDSLARCFIALDLDSPAIDALVALQPDDLSVRRTPADQLHLTLHFLGEQDVDAVMERLGKVVADPPVLRIDTLGSFVGADGAVILWAGVEPSIALLTLRDACARALRPLGFEVEARPYRPHVTLGRARAGFDAASFVAQRSPGLTVRPDRFHLYRSKLTSSGPVYTRAGSMACRSGGADDR